MPVERKIEWRSKHDVDHDRVKQKAHVRAKNPEAFNYHGHTDMVERYKNLTVPGQAKSIKDLLERYEKGRPKPVE